jgi:hypothetical protein
MNETAIGERVTAVETKVETLDRDVQSVAEKLDRLQFWILCTFGGVVVGVGMMVFEMAVKK